MLSGILGRKVGMTQVFGPNGTAVPATVIEAGPCTITQVKSVPVDGYEAVQIGFGTIRLNKATRPMLGQLGHALPVTPRQRKKQQAEQARERQKARDAKAATTETTTETTATETEAEQAEAAGATAPKTAPKSAKGKTKSGAKPARKGEGGSLGPFQTLREVRILDGAAVHIGETVNAGMFRVGEEVDVIGTSKGKGFGGVMKRHGFRGGPRTHGQSDRARAPGSIGPGTTPGRVLKGTRMAGHLGDDRVTIQKLEVLQADPERNLLVIKGSVPGPNGGTLMIRKIAGQTQLLAHLRAEPAPAGE
ncbi:MAG TPA: 50S ribosomal protein L3 [Ktedonobacterales bacterium]|nr:50S ribosomal protein L3 [Ktedonobacterales bacterium]